MDNQHCYDICEQIGCLTKAMQDVVKELKCLNDSVVKLQVSTPNKASNISGCFLPTTPMK